MPLKKFHIFFGILPLNGVSQLYLNAKITCNFPSISNLCWSIFCQSQRESDINVAMMIMKMLRMIMSQYIVRMMSLLKIDLNYCFRSYCDWGIIFQLLVVFSWRWEMKSSFQISLLAAGFIVAYCRRMKSFTMVGLLAPCSNLYTGVVSFTRH